MNVSPYKLLSMIISFQRGTWVFPNTPLTSNIIGLGVWISRWPKSIYYDTMLKLSYNSSLQNWLSIAQLLATRCAGSEFKSHIFYFSTLKVCESQHLVSWQQKKKLCGWKTYRLRGWHDEFMDSQLMGRLLCSKCELEVSRCLERWRLNVLHVKWPINSLS